METFKRLLLPISSEFFSENIVERAGEITKIFGSEVYALYIIEEKTLKKMEEIAELFLTEKQRKEMEDSIINRGRDVANIIFREIEKYIPFFKKDVTTGEFSDIIIEKAEGYNATCIIMGFEKECFLKYRLLEEIKIPVWVEIKRGKSILGVCSNLAPNVKVPKFTLELSWDQLEVSPSTPSKLSSDKNDILEQGDSQRKFSLFLA